MGGGKRNESREKGERENEEGEDEVKEGGGKGVRWK